MNTDFHALPKEALIDIVNECMKVINHVTVENKELSLAVEVRDKKLIQAEQTIAEKEAMLLWFRRQLFGSRSERRLLASSEDDQRIPFSFLIDAPSTPPAPSTTVAQYERKHRVKEEVEFVESDSRLKFEAGVPVEEITLPSPLADEEEACCIGEKITYRLAQRPSSYVVLKYVQKTYKKKSDGVIISSSLAPAIIERSFSDVSFLAGLLVDKVLFHLPLYRQHQRLLQGGIHLERATLTKLFTRAAELLEPLYHAQLSSILSSSVIAMDETPLMAGLGKGKMKKAYLWPLYGDNDEVAFLFSPSRGKELIVEILKDFDGTLHTDGYSVYERYAEERELTHALCWAHARRKFFDIATLCPVLVKPVLSLIGELYALEGRAQDSEQKGKMRKEVMAEKVQSLFAHVEEKASLFTKQHPFTKAASYMLSRRKGLSVFLSDPAVSMDTNHLERLIRPLAVGRKNWLFCFTEVGARRLGHLYSLLLTCRLHKVDPYIYLVDVLQRISTHPMREVHLLTPRFWKEHFAENPLRSPLG